MTNIENERERGRQSSSIYVENAKNSVDALKFAFLIILFLRKMQQFLASLIAFLHMSFRIHSLVHRPRRK